MEINIQQDLKKSFTVTIDSLDITIDELKKKVESAMEEPKIPAEDQILIVSQKKTENGKKLSDYVKTFGSNDKVFVIRRSKDPNPISKPATNTGNTQQNGEFRAQNQSQMGGNPYVNNYGQAPNPYQGFGQMSSPYGGGYGSPHGMFSQMPPQYQGYPGYGSPQQGFGQMPPYGGNYGSPQGGAPFGQGDNNGFSRMMMQQMQQMIENPAAFDQMLNLHGQHLSPEQREEQKKMLKSAVEMMKTNPELFKQALTPESVNWALNNMNNGGMGMGFPPMQPQMGFNHGSPSGTGPCSHGYYPPVVVDGKPEPQSYEQVFSEQLTQLNEMGFTNTKKNIEALKEANGDINRALDILYGNMK